MSNRTRNLHAWTTRTTEGLKREVRAQLFGKNWTVTSRYKGEDDWITHDPPLLEDLEELLEVVSRKYQRRRLSREHLETVQRLLDRRTDLKP